MAEPTCWHPKARIGLRQTLHATLSRLTERNLLWSTLWELLPSVGFQLLEPPGQLCCTLSTPFKSHRPLAKLSQCWQARIPSMGATCSLLRAALILNMLLAELWLCRRVPGPRPVASIYVPTRPSTWPQGLA